MTGSIVSGPPVPQRGEERFFDRGEGDAACARALAGGVAIHGDLNDESGVRPLRVLGQLPVLLAWGGRHGLPARHLRTTRRGCPPHFHVHGRLALQLVGRARRLSPTGEAEGRRDG